MDNPAGNSLSWGPSLAAIGGVAFAGLLMALGCATVATDPPGRLLTGTAAAGLLMGFSTLLSGYLYDVAGARGYWAMAAIAAGGGALALLLAPPKLRAPAATPR